MCVVRGCLGGFESGIYGCPEGRQRPAQLRLGLDGRTLAAWKGSPSRGARHDVIVVEAHQSKQRPEATA
jgi:hypothetical protein